MRRDPQKELQFAAGALARADQLVATQERRIEQLRPNDQDPTIAEAMLPGLRPTQEVMRKNLEMIEAEIIEKSE